jgi:hypothetical protein
VAAGRRDAGRFDTAFDAGAGGVHATVSQHVVAPLGAVVPLWPDAYEREVRGVAADVGHQHESLARGVQLVVERFDDRACKPRRVRNSSMPGCSGMAGVVFNSPESCRPWKTAGRFLPTVL